MQDRSAEAGTARHVAMPLALLALAVAWLATRPYVGAVRDAQLYLVQAIAWMDPSRFSTDLYFAFGSQDRFTIFSWLYGPLVGGLGPGPAHAVALGAGQGLWLLGAWVLAAALLPDRRDRLLGLAGLILLPAGYSHLGIIQYGELYVTPRLFAEAAVLAALGAGLRGRWGVAAGLVVLGALLHPLIALPGAAILVLLRALGSARLAVPLVGAALLAIACLPLLPGEAGPLLRMDDAWRDVVASIAPLTLPAEWTFFPLAKLALHLCLALLLLLGLDGPAKRVVLAALVGASLGLLLVVVGGEVARLQIVLAAQPWRALWPLLCLTNLLLLPLVGRQLLAPGPLAERATGALLLVGLAAGTVQPGMLAAALPVALLALLRAVLSRLGVVPAGPLRLLLDLALAVAGGWALAVIVIGLQYMAASSPGLPWMALRLVVLSALALWLLRAALGGRRSAALALAGVALLVLAVATHDRRTPWQRFLDAPGPEQASLDPFVPPGETFWDGGLGLLWFRLHRPAFFSCVQGSGVLFFRATAMAFRDRTANLPFQQREGRCIASLQPADGPPDRATLARACRAEPTLDHIIIGSVATDLAPAATWMLPVGRSFPDMIAESYPAGEVHRYDCAALR